jgi:hypothetical protein
MDGDILPIENSPNATLAHPSFKSAKTPAGVNQYAQRRLIARTASPQ